MSASMKRILISLLASEVWGTGPKGAHSSGNLLGKTTPLDVRMASGTGSGQVNKVFAKTISIGAGATYSLDLSGGETDDEGNSITLTSLKGICIVNFNTGDTISLKEPASNPVAGLFAGGSGGGITCQAALSAVHPGVALAHMPAGVTVTAGTGDKVDIVNDDSGDAVTPTLIFYGVDAS